MSEEIVIPKYSFQEVEGEELPPVRRTIGKTHEITETFTVYDIFKGLAMLEKRIADSKAQTEMFEKQRENYLAEIEVIEEQLGVSNLQDEYQKAMVEEVQKADEIKENEDVDA